MEIVFILKKIISSLIMPLPFSILIIFIGLVFLYINSLKKAKIIISFGLFLLFIFSYVPFSNLLLYPLESQYKKLQNAPTDIKYILLLGGNREARGWEALRLHHKLPNAKIITSGYAGRGEVPEAIRTANILINLGISKESIIMHPKPKDTIEEAIKIKELLKDERFILITSAYHMPRAMKIFENQGLYPLAAPTDFLIKDSDKIISCSEEYNLHKSKKAWHEYIGLLWLYIKD